MALIDINENDLVVSSRQDINDNFSELDNRTTTLDTQVQDLENTKAEKDNVLELDNTDAYTPTTNYHPATKKYSDDGDSTIQGDLDSHKLDTNNPHSVTKSQVGLSNADNTSDIDKPISTAQQSALDLKADLVAGKVPASQLPSYVDDVLEFPTLGDFPVTGETGKVYIAIDTNLSYRWGGSVYSPLAIGNALGETSTTAYRGDRGKIAYDHSQVTDSNPHNTSLDQLSDVVAPTPVDGQFLKWNGSAWVNAPVENIEIIKLDTSPTPPIYAEGQMYWNPADKTLNIENGDGTTTQVAQEMHTVCKNMTGADLTNGKVAYISGSNGTRPTIALAKANSYSTADATLGMLTQDIINTEEGKVTTRGLVNGLDTSSFTAGQELYLSATVAGGLTTTQPLAPNLVVHVGHVIKVHATDGSIYIDPVVVTQTSNSVTLDSGTGVQELNNVQDFFRHAWSSGATEGFAITDNGNGTINIAEGEIVIRETNADDAVLKTYLIPAITNLTMTANDVSYLYLTYGSGTATWTVGTSISAFDGITKVIVFVVGRNVNRLNIVDLRKINVDFGRKNRRQKVETDGVIYNGWYRSILGQSPISSVGLNITVGAGKYFYFDNVITHSAFDTTVAGASDLNNFINFYNRTGTWTQETGQKTVDNTQYDLAGVKTNLGANKYRADYWYVVMCGSNPYLACIMGNAQYNSLSSAQTAPQPSTLPPQIEGIAILLGQSVVKKSDSTLTVQRAVANLLSSVGASSASGTSTDTTNFNGLLSVADNDVQKALDTLDNSLPRIIQQAIFASQVFN